MDDILKKCEEANEAYKNGNIEKSLELNNSCIDIIKKMFTDHTLPEEEADTYIKKSVNIYLNLSRCNLKLEDYTKVVYYTTKIIELEPSNIKAFYFRCLGNIGLDVKDKAEVDLEKLKVLGLSKVELSDLEEKLKNKRGKNLYDSKREVSTKQTNKSISKSSNSKGLISSMIDEIDGIVEFSTYCFRLITYSIIRI